jgi:hypothetical protein
MNDLGARIREHLDDQERVGWHIDWPEALDALRAVLDVCENIDMRGHGFDSRLIREHVARALGIPVEVPADKPVGGEPT